MVDENRQPRWKTRRVMLAMTRRQSKVLWRRRCLIRGVEFDVWLGRDIMVLLFDLGGIVSILRWQVGKCFTSIHPARSILEVTSAGEQEIH